MLQYLKYLVLTATRWALTTSDETEVGAKTAAGENVLVGGQAVIEGVMMRSPTGCGIAVRRPDGSVAQISEPLAPVGSKWRIFRLPFFRGVAVLGQALVLGIRALRFSAQEAMDDGSPEPTRSKRGDGSDGASADSLFLAGNLVVAILINLALFVGLPLVLTRLLERQFGFDNLFLFNGIDGLLRVTVFLAFIYAMSRMEDMRRVFAYHGAEHKTVYAFEANEPLTARNAQKHSTLHPRCGTSFLLVVMVVSILVFSVFHFDGFILRLLSRVVLMPAVAGISYEIIRYSARNPGFAARWIMAPGLALQKITTNPPDDEQVEIAILALEDALAVEQSTRT